MLGQGERASVASTCHAKTPFVAASAATPGTLSGVLRAQTTAQPLHRGVSPGAEANGDGICRCSWVVTNE
eukprot:1157526-Pelagomonas_calceolata.AAC.3